MRLQDRIRTAAMAVVVLAATTSIDPAEGQYAGSDFRGFPAPGYNAVGVRDDGSTAAGTWLGGDGGFLTALPNKTIFASFSDSAIGPGTFLHPPCDLNNDTTPCLTAQAIRAASNRDSPGNSIALVSFVGNTSRVRYYFRGDPGRGGLSLGVDCENPDPAGPAGARAFFPVTSPPKDSPYYRDYRIANCHYKARIWPRKAVLINAHLYVFGNFVTDGGRVENTILIRVNNPLDPPPAWSLDYLYLDCFDREAKKGYPLWATGTAAPCFFGNEAFVAVDPHDTKTDYLYTYGTFNKGGELYDYCPGNGFTVFPMRLRVADLEHARPNQDISPAAQYAPADISKGRWLPGLYDVGRAAATGGRSMVVVGDNTNFASLAYSIRPNLTTGLWQAVYNQESKMGNRRHFDDPAFLKRICFPAEPTRTDPGGYSAFIATGPTAYGPFHFEAATELFHYPGLSSPATDDAGRAILANANLGLKSYATREVPEFAPDDLHVALVTTTAGPLNTQDSRSADLKLYTPLKYLVRNPLANGPGVAPDALGPYGVDGPLRIAPPPRRRSTAASPAEDSPKGKPAPKVIRSVPSRPGG